MTLREEVIRKNEILNQRIMEMEMSKRKFDEELKKLHEKSVIFNFIYIFHFFGLTLHRFQIIWLKTIKFTQL